MKDLILADQLPTARLSIKHQPKQQTFYLLPKICKVNNPGQPIISACSCPTEHSSEYSDVILQPLVWSLPTDIKTASMPSTWLAVSTKAQTLTKYLPWMSHHCTHASHTDGLKALQYFLNKCSTLHPPTDILICYAELVLTNNTFSFRDEVFSHMNGVVMGTKLGPSYACLSSWDNLNKNCSNSTANQCLRCSKHNQWW